MPGSVPANLPTQDVDALAVVDGSEVVGGEPADRVGAERVERHVAEVQQAGEAHDDVQAQRHDDVGERQRHVVDHVVQRVAEQREHARAPSGPRWP